MKSMPVLLAAALTACGASDDSPIAATAMVGDVEIHYLERPSPGPLVLFLHGFPDDAHSWNSITENIHSDRYRTVAPFLRGYPPSSVVNGDTTVDDLARDILGLMDALGEEQAILVAHDWGASAAYAAANLAPERIRGLVTIAIAHPQAILADPSVLAESPHFMTLAAPGASATFREEDFAAMDTLLALWSPTWSYEAADRERIIAMFEVPGALESALGYYRGFFAGPPPAYALAPTSVPNLTIYGTRDGAGSAAPFARQASAFTGPVEVRPLDAGHFPHREKEAEFLAALRAFLTTLPAE